MPEYEGVLRINQDEGTATFYARDMIYVADGARILRVTHLATPVPDDVSIDVVSIFNITSYTPLGQCPSLFKDKS